MPGEAYPIETTGRLTREDSEPMTQNPKRFKFHRSGAGTRSARALQHT
jgi:hypothetical protein